MSVSLYMDEHVQFEITRALRHRGVDVRTVQDDHLQHANDEVVLDRATALGRVLFSRDEDLLRIGSQRQRDSIEFAGIIYGHQLNLSIGECIAELELVCLASDLHDFQNLVQYLPIR